MTEIYHPGTYIREWVIPQHRPVKEAAKLLGGGHPALSNLIEPQGPPFARDGKPALCVNMGTTPLPQVWPCRLRRPENRRAPVCTEDRCRWRLAVRTSSERTGGVQYDQSHGWLSNWCLQLSRRSRSGRRRCAGAGSSGEVQKLVPEARVRVSACGQYGRGHGSDV
jgi:hypothetical protein